MKDILFKAKRVDNGEWVKGYCIKQYEVGEEAKSYIYIPTSPWGFSTYGIDPETLCQFTGKGDCDFFKIWENDIVKYDGEYGRVKWVDSEAAYMVEFNGRTNNLGEFARCDLQVVGNYIDNPELLEVEE